MLPLPNPARGNPHGLGDGSRAFDALKTGEILEAAQQARLPVGVVMHSSGAYLGGLDTGEICFVIHAAGSRRPIRGGSVFE